MADAARTDRDEVAAYLALTQVPGIGWRRLRALLQAFGTAAGCLRAPHDLIARLSGLTAAAATAIRATSPQHGHAILDELDRLGASVILPDDSAFPALLREIHEPPMALFVWGRAELLDRASVAMVGSRNHSAYGAAAARLLARGVAPYLAVVSGMARGLDALAHSVALDAGGSSIGVLGNGFGVIYPASNAILYERMIKEGCLVTELPPGERPNAGTFPRRNRLISGLTRVTIVLEAAPKSGALITADEALNQGRTVLAVPGPITSPTSQGCNKLIQQGAKPVLCVEDVLEEYGLSVVRPSLATEAAVLETLTAVQRTLWNSLVERQHVDVLVSVAGTDSGTVLTALTEMEMRGLVRQGAGMLFERAG